MPVGGQSSFYTYWYSPSSFNHQGYTYKWETFLTRELPLWLASNKHISTTGNGVVGLPMSGFLNPSALVMQQAIRVAVLDADSYNVDSMWGPWDSAWNRNDQQVSRIVANGTRLWIYCAPGGNSDVNPNPNKDFQDAYANAGGKNATFVFSAAGNPAWPYWGQQLTSVKPDLIATLNG
jgi:diacylglycerol O-acyltransferase/trehalose O-mycolyltransferase